MEGAAPVDAGTVADRVLGGWLGRCVGNGLGKPFELPTWSARKIRDYLERAGAWPLADHVPVLDPMPPSFELREDCWQTTTRGRVAYATRDDDLDYTILNLMLLEQYGVDFTTENVGRLWLDLLPFGKTFTAEAAAYRNLTEGLAAPETATRLNPYREWIGALIRADAFGFVNPGRPLAAALLAARDARLSHTRNGIYGAMWAAAAVAAAFAARSPSEIVAAARAVVPPRSRLVAAIDRIVALHRQGAPWSDAIALIESIDHYYVHVINNAAVIAAALLWSDGEFTRGIALAVCAGLDTDSNGATVGAILGVYNGANAIPRAWTDPLNNELRTALCGQASLSLSDLAKRTVALIALK
ncbi:MAG: hypothetical protein CVT82_15345 [Alphaproteobacteria bacterium HGW-Alphaproteobacteria-4]|nr:MAG: hypothetical protein CVT82_15345 [Alphaproteobacteria bacterium HGW-Alphaproteobacteria-4]